ncbi:BON domain-containing protein [Rhodobacteraceae bacterium NNCM2]|nr:BON domain-containing protein [Coraliihabitans acroporae]
MKSLTALLVSAVALSTVGACTLPGAIVGTGAVVTRSVLQERSTLQALNDTEIEISILNRLGNHSGELFRDVSVDVIEGRVLLTGSVPEREDKVAATEATWAVPGVVEVTDDLTVEEDSGTQAYAEDVWISSQIRYHMLTDLKISSVNYNVTTVDKVVHLTGLARSPAELTQVVDYASSVKGVQRVVSHVLLIDDPRRIEQIAKAG